ncbi:hypothetical protein Pan153_20760 [Gimesia panareensis]|uniref:Uncharacterized protein n=1 Tax=Gimesia panareensis TaxID=2527978 RepID=A0A518FM39_9PLAN|nr:hypothetical protein Pan153_20760 [Gimesia panareensis]
MIAVSFQRSCSGSLPWWNLLGSSLLNGDDGTVLICEISLHNADRKQGRPHGANLTRDVDSGVSTDCEHLVDRHMGVKTKFCPNVARLCPVFVPILSNCDLSRDCLLRTGSQ